MSHAENRGRPRTYQFPERRRIAEIIGQYGARGAREVLSRKICLDTLLKIAGEFDIELKTGRRPRKAA